MRRTLSWQYGRSCSFAPCLISEGTSGGEMTWMSELARMWWESRPPLPHWSLCVLCVALYLWWIFHMFLHVCVYVWSVCVCVPIMCLLLVSMQVFMTAMYMFACKCTIYTYRCTPQCVRVLMYAYMYVCMQAYLNPTQQTFSWGLEFFPHESGCLSRMLACLLLLEDLLFLRHPTAWCMYLCMYVNSMYVYTYMYL
jgi:hypothetical protein